MHKESESKKDDLNLILTATGIIIIIIVILLVTFIVLKKKKKKEPELEMPIVEAEIETEEQPPGETGAEQLSKTPMPMPEQLQAPPSEIQLGLPPAATDESIAKRTALGEELVEETAAIEPSEPHSVGPGPEVAPSTELSTSIPSDSILETTTKPQELTVEPEEQELNEPKKKYEQQQKDANDS